MTHEYTHCPSCSRDRKTLMVFDDHEYCPACGYHSFTNRRDMLQLPQLETFDWSSRKISSKILDKYGVGFDSERGHIVMPHYSPTMELLCYVTRTPGQRDFHTHGSTAPYGLHLLGNSEELIICEGQSDTLSAATVWPKKDVIGLPGAQTTSRLKAYLSHLRKYQRITVLPDSDEAGQDMVERLREILPASKLYVASLSGKDVSSLLEDGRVDELQGAYDLAVRQYSSVFVTPEDIDQYYSEESQHLIPTGLPGLDRMLGGGLEVSGMTFIAGHTGKGKSSLSYNIICGAIKGGHKTLYLAGEVSPSQSVQRLAKVWDSQAPHTREYGKGIAKHMWEHGLRVYKYSLDTDLMLDVISDAVMNEDVTLVVVDVLSDIQDFDYKYEVAGRAIKSLRQHALGDDREGRPPFALLCVAHTKGNPDDQVTLGSIRGGTAVTQAPTCVLALNLVEGFPNRRQVSFLKYPRTVDNYDPRPITLEYDRYTYQYTKVGHDTKENGEGIRLTARRGVPHSVPTSDLPPEGITTVVSPDKIEGNPQPPV